MSDRGPWMECLFDSMVHSIARPGDVPNTSP